MAAALLAVLLGGPLGVAAARRELALAHPSAPRAFAGAAVRLALLQGALVGGAALRTALLTPCSPSFGLAFVPAVALPSALAAAALGVLAGTVGGGRGVASAGLYLAGLLASLSATLLEGWLGPASYLLDPFLGIWPGPIYDEALALDRRLLLFRLATLAWTAAMVGAATVAAARRRTPPARSRAGLAVVVLAPPRRGRRPRGGRAHRRPRHPRRHGPGPGRKAHGRPLRHPLPPGEAGRGGGAALPRLRGRRRRGGGGPGRGPSTSGEGVGPPVRGGEAASRRRRPDRVHQALARRDPGARRAGGTARAAPRDRPRGGGEWWRVARSASRRGTACWWTPGSWKASPWRSRSRAASGPRTSGPAP